MIIIKNELDTLNIVIGYLNSIKNNDIEMLTHTREYFIKLKSLNFVIETFDKNINLGLKLKKGASSKKEATLIIKQFIDLINISYTEIVPFSINKNGKVFFKREQRVRNCGTLYVILKLQNLIGGFSPVVMKRVKIDMEYYIELFELNKNQMRQASAFLGLAIKEYIHYSNSIDKIFLKVQREICKFLTKSLPKLERSFELGEVMIFLKECCSNNNKLLLIEQQKMKKEIEDDDLMPDKVFKYNWHAKFLFSLHYDMEFESGIRGQPELEKSVESHARFLAKQLKMIIKGFDFDNVETNYLAVCFEACSALSMIDKNVHISINQNLNPTIRKLFESLKSRINDSNKLFSFLNGNSRIDITGHVIEGLLYLFY